MSAENMLKERLACIAKNDYRVQDEAEVWPMALQMIQLLGSTDPELRDLLITETLHKWGGLYFDAQQLATLLNIALDDDHLFHGLGEQGTDSVFMRAFSSLIVASFVSRHRGVRPFLSPSAVGETHRRMLSCLSRERDLRGYVEDKGWAHAVAHAADALDELALCPELDGAALLETLRTIREVVVNATVVFVDEEDERLVAAVLSAIQRQVLTQGDVSEWLRSFASFELPATYQEWLHRKTNIKHFLRSLYFRSLYRGVGEAFEPALAEILQEVSERPIPATYF